MAMATRILLIALLATPLAAQLPTLPDGVQAPPATAEKESFVVQPKNLAAGAKDVTLRLVCNTASGFNTSSAKPPELKFSTGVALKAASFALLNANEAECRVDVADDAFGTCDVSLELFSVNGTQVLSTLRATLGLTGPVSVTGSQAKVGCESVELVRVNVSNAQKAGALLIMGRVTGAVSITAPTGTLFSKAPAVTTTAGNINTPALGSNNTVFTFTIGNAAQDDLTVRVGDIEYNTQLYGLSGGTANALACEITGAALSNQSALVVNAHTAKTTVAGRNDNTSTGGSGSTTPPPAEETPTTTQPAASVNNPGTGQGRSLEDSPRERRNRDNQPQGGSSGALQPSGRAQSEGPRPANNPPPPPQIQPAGGQPGQAPPQPAPAGAAPVASGGGTGTNAADGSIKPMPAQQPQPGTTSNNRLTVEDKPAPLVVTPGLYFCDKDFKALGAVVLDKTVGGEAGGRVWILLKRAKDKDPTKVETVTVTLKVCGVARELVLTETGKDTGEFRCSKEGVLLLAAENPDSNTEEATAEPAKIRLPR